MFITGMQVEDGISGPEPDPPTETSPSLGSWTTSLWSTPAKEEQKGNLQSSPKTGSQSTGDDSFWSSFFDSPSKKQSLTSPPSAVKKTPASPASGHQSPHSGITPKSRLQGKKEPGHKVLNTSAKSRRKLPHSAKSEAEVGEGGPSLGHPSKPSSSGTDEANAPKQEANQSTPTGEAPAAGAVPEQSLPTDVASLEESGKELPSSGGWQSQPLVSVDAVEDARAESVNAKSEVRASTDKCSSEKEEPFGTHTDLSEVVEHSGVSRTEEGKNSPGGPSEVRPFDASGKDMLLIQLDQRDEPGHEMAAVLPPEELDKRGGDDLDGGQLQQASPPPDVISVGETLEESLSTAVKYQPAIEAAAASTEVGQHSTPSNESHPSVSEDADNIGASAPDDATHQQMLPDSGSADEQRGADGDAGQLQVEGHSPLPPDLPSHGDGPSTAETGVTEAGQHAEELQKREEAHEEFEQERSQSVVGEQEAPCREGSADEQGDLLGEGQPLSSPEHRREDQEEFMTPATSLVPLASAHSQAELETQLRNVQEVLYAACGTDCVVCILEVLVELNVTFILC